MQVLGAARSSSRGRLVANLEAAIRRVKHKGTLNPNPIPTMPASLVLVLVVGIALLAGLLAYRHGYEDGRLARMVDEVCPRED